MTKRLNRFKFTRREWIGLMLVGSTFGFSALPVAKWIRTLIEEDHAVFATAVKDYSQNLTETLRQGFFELGLHQKEIQNKTVLLKPNLVEPHAGHTHINTHPLLIRAAIELFLSFGAAEVIVAEGAGHMRDSLYCLEETGLGEILQEDSIPFVDLNTTSFVRTSNAGNRSYLGDLFLPSVVVNADFVVSLAKMKTHHWAGVTLSMKNLFGVMPGSVYGWPKNRLHKAGIPQSILDITATVRPDFAIIDGIVGMEGDGPIMGEPIESGVLIMGRNPSAVDASAARIMGFRPETIDYLSEADKLIGSINERNIQQRGEEIRTLKRPFKLIDLIPVHKRIKRS